MWDDRSDLFDARIDAVAQRMTVGEPRADLTARVLDRIAAERPRSIPAAWSLSFAPVGILAIVGIVAIGAAVLLRSGHPPPPNHPRTFVNGPLHAPHAVDAIVKAPAHNVSATSGAARPVRARLPAPTPSQDELIAHLQMEPLTVQPMQLPAIEAPPSVPPEAIGLTRLTVIPLSSEGEP